MRRVWIVAGLGFGDEGKGGVVDWLVRRHAATLVVRYNGGPQAAHHVVTTHGVTHCFAQFGAGTLVPGVFTHLSRFMLIDPLALLAEAQALAANAGVDDALARLTVDPRCVVVTPFHRILNQMSEVARGASRHGSCGRGVGQAQLDSEHPDRPVPRMGDFVDVRKLREVLHAQWEFKCRQAAQLVEAHPDNTELTAMYQDLLRSHRVSALTGQWSELVKSKTIRLRMEPPVHDVAVFEGAQGVLLDRDHGFWPYVTPSHTTFRNAETLLAEWAPEAVQTRVGLLRAYATRHGAGPFPTENPELSAALPDRHNGTDRWQGQFRVGWFDGELARYAIDVCNGIDALVLTNVDRLAQCQTLHAAARYQQAPRVQSVDRYEDWPVRTAQTEALQKVRLVLHRVEKSGSLATRDPVALARAILDAAEVPIPLGAVSWGPTARHKTVCETQDTGCAMSEMQQ